MTIIEELHARVSLLEAQLRRMSEAAAEAQRREEAAERALAALEAEMRAIRRASPLLALKHAYKTWKLAAKQRRKAKAAAERARESR